MSLGFQDNQFGAATGIPNVGPASNGNFAPPYFPTAIHTDTGNVIAPWTTSNPPNITNYLAVYNGTGSIVLPAEATSIAGFEVWINRFSNKETGVKDFEVYLANNINISGGAGYSILSNNKASGILWPTGAATLGYGGQNDLWGLSSPTFSLIAESGFGVLLKASGFSELPSFNPKNANVDSIQLRVWYNILDIAESSIFLYTAGHLSETGGLSFYCPGQVETKWFDLATLGHMSGNSATHLYEVGHDTITGSLNLYTPGHDSYSSGVDLFMTSFLVETGNIDFSLNGYDLSSGDVNFFTWNFVEHSGSVNLYALSHESITGSIPFVVTGVGTQNTSFNFFVLTEEWKPSSGSIPFHSFSLSTISGIHTVPGYNDFNFFLQSDHFPGPINFTLLGDTKAIVPKSIPFYVAVPDIEVGTTATIPFMVSNNVTGLTNPVWMFAEGLRAGGDYYLDGAGFFPYTGGVSLYIERNTPATFNMFLCNQIETGGLSMYSMGAFTGFDSVNLVIPSSVDTITNKHLLYTRGR